MPSFHVRCVRSISLNYSTASRSPSNNDSTGEPRSPSSPAIDIESSPELLGLHAVLLLGSSDTSDEERAIYEAFIRSRSEPTFKTQPKHSTLLVCADGAVASKAGKASSHAAVAFDVVCGDFDSIPLLLLSLLVGDGSNTGGSSISTSAPVAEFFHITELYRKGCRFVSDPRMRLTLPVTTGDSEAHLPDAAITLSEHLHRRQVALGQKVGSRQHSEEMVPALTADPSQAPALVVKVDCQMTTDFEKCCQLLEIHHIVRTQSQSQVTSDSEGGEGDGDILSSIAPPLPRILVLGALGGRLDHELAVFNTLFNFVNRLDLLIYNGNNTIFAIKPNSLVSFTRDPTIDGHTVGVIIFGNPSNRVVTKGLKWELSPELVIGFGHTQSTSNKLVGIEVERGESSTSEREMGDVPDARGSQMESHPDDEPAKVRLSDPMVAPLLANNNRVEKNLTEAELKNTFIVDTRGVSPGTFVLVTVPRLKRRRAASSTASSQSPKL
eukprot:GILI01016652.1.p1 GENE.GILI01016652.1~~GILI01016652.1.p1  ORF type:complete len:495 (+),score=78.66 GILI01016652.1:104-1588(+)